MYKKKNSVTTGNANNFSQTSKTNSDTSSNVDNRVETTQLSTSDEKISQNTD